MVILDAYCIQLKRCVSITEARTEFLNQSKYKNFEFLCSTPSCREKGVKIVGVNYKIHPSDNHHNAPHYRSKSGQKEAHCNDCYLSYNLNQQLPGETPEEFELKKTRSRLSDYVDEFYFTKCQKVPDNTINGENQNTQKGSVSAQNNTRNTISTPLSRYTKTTQLIRLVESYLDSREKLKNDLFKTLPLKVEGSKVKYLYQYFYSIKKGIEYKKHCVYQERFSILAKIEMFHSQ